MRWVSVHFMMCSFIWFKAVGEHFNQEAGGLPECFTADADINNAGIF